MKIRVRVHNQENKHEVRLDTNGKASSIEIAGKPSGFGSSVNGGELLFLALATCYCNDVYREAEKKGIKVVDVQVEVEGEFGGVGEPARNVRFNTSVVASGANEDEVQQLLLHTDKVAEIQNTVRQGVGVDLGHSKARAAWRLRKLLCFSRLAQLPLCV